MAKPTKSISNDTERLAPAILLIEQLSRRSGYAVGDILNHVIDWMIGFFDPQGLPVPGWRLKKEFTIDIMAISAKVMDIACRRIDSAGWYDAFGDLFMFTQGDKKGLGQCFTPSSVCDMMSEMALQCEPKKTYCTTFGMCYTINDPTCGSGRWLLSAAAKLRREYGRKIYCVGSDIDSRCCKITAINLMLHGFYGEVIRHDTLMDPNGVDEGYIINEGQYPLYPGLPTIRRTCDKSQFYSVR